MAMGLHVDESLNVSEEVRFKQKHRNVMWELSRTTHFTLDCVQRLSLIYYHVIKLGKKHAKGITRDQLMEILHYGFSMTDYRLMDLILAILDKGEIFERNIWTLSKWVKTLSLITRGTLEEKIRYAFDIYQSKVAIEPVISRRTMIKHLRHSMIKDIGADEDADDESVKDLVDLMLKKMDHDGDGSLSFYDFRKSVLEEPLMLQCLGLVLPDRHRIYTFKHTFTDNCDFL